MTITLGGITISDNMYLDGLESQPQVSVEQVRTIDGTSVVRTKSLNLGGTFTLGTQTLSGAVQGIWCLSYIQQIKALEQLGAVVVLDYKGTQYNVVIEGTNFSPMFQWEPEGPDKKFTGTVSLIEV